MTVATIAAALVTVTEQENGSRPRPVSDELRPQVEALLFSFLPSDGSCLAHMAGPTFCVLTLGASGTPQVSLTS